MISVNTLGASLAINDLLARLHPFRDEPNHRFATIRFSVTQTRLVPEPEGEPCTELAKKAGRGDVRPLLDSAGPQHATPMTLWDAVTWVGHRLRRLFTRRPPKYLAVHVTEMPESVDDRVVYIAGEGDHRWFAAFRCPCGCGELIQLSLHLDGRPRWRVREHADGTVSIWPSVNRKRGCGSHFWLEHGRVR